MFPDGGASGDWLERECLARRGRENPALVHDCRDGERAPGHVLLHEREGAVGFGERREHPVELVNMADEAMTPLDEAPASSDERAPRLDDEGERQRRRETARLLAGLGRIPARNGEPDPACRCEARDLVGRELE